MFLVLIIRGIRKTEPRAGIMETSILSRFSVTSLSLVYLWTDWTWGGALPPPELPQFQLGGQMPHKTMYNPICSIHNGILPITTSSVIEHY